MIYKKNLWMLCYTYRPHAKSLKMRKFKRKKGPVRANKVSFDGIKFASGLEKYMYIALKKAKIKSEYERRI